MAGETVVSIIIPVYNGEEFLRQCLEFVVGVCTEEVVHHCRYFIQKRPTLFKRQNGIGECGCLGVIHNSVNLRHLLGNALANGGFNMFVSDLVERSEGI